MAFSSNKTAVNSVKASLFLHVQYELCIFHNKERKAKMDSGG